MLLALCMTALLPTGLQPKERLSRAQRNLRRCGCCLVLFPDVPAISQSPEEM
jgi:hypothetical protein